jgi:hypothetical protein
MDSVGILSLAWLPRRSRAAVALPIYPYPYLYPSSPVSLHMLTPVSHMHDRVRTPLQPLSQLFQIDVVVLSQLGWRRIVYLY